MNSNQIPKAIAPERHDKQSLPNVSEARARVLEELSQDGSDEQDDEQTRNAVQQQFAQLHHDEDQPLRASASMQAARNLFDLIRRMKDVGEATGIPVDSGAWEELRISFARGSRARQRSKPTRRTQRGTRRRRMSGLRWSECASSPLSCFPYWPIAIIPTGA
ncbi:MAG: hypothetical protein M3N47_08865 [Chloroflexota bacterium]|nr:hypothetical protein [Chloroflexota bacterium]